MINPLLVGRLPYAGEIDVGVNAERPIILLLPIYKNTIMTKTLFISSWFDRYIGVCTLRSIVLSESAILRVELKIGNSTIFKKAFNSIPFQRISMKIIHHRLKVSSCIILLVSEFLNDNISFRSLEIYLEKNRFLNGFIEWPILTKEVSFLT